MTLLFSAFYNHFSCSLIFFNQRIIDRNHEALEEKLLSKAWRIEGCHAYHSHMSSLSTWLKCQWCNLFCYQTKRIFFLRWHWSLVCQLWWRFSRSLNWLNLQGSLHLLLKTLEIFCTPLTLKMPHTQWNFSKQTKSLQKTVKYFKSNRKLAKKTRWNPGFSGCFY